MGRPGRAGGRKVLVALVDNAGWHIARRLVVHRLPSCTPERQPAEPLWPLVREALANKASPTLDGLRTPLEKRCEGLAENPATVKGAVGFHWAIALG